MYSSVTFVLLLLNNIFVGFMCWIFFSVIFFFCKQKTAYEMRISDLSSDVCSSDLMEHGWETILNRSGTTFKALDAGDKAHIDSEKAIQIGRASCRERVCQ